MGNAHPTSTPALRRGAAAVELAIVLPLLLLLGIGAVDVGRALSTATAVSNAARVGADWAATHRFTDETVDSWRDRIRSETTTEMEGVAGFSAADLDIEIAWVEAGDEVRVTVSAEYVFRPTIDWPAFPNEFPLRQAVTVTQYR